MDSEETGNALQSTLSELAHLLTDPSRLSIVKDSEVGCGGYGDVYLATLDGTLKVAVKQLRIVLARGTRVRVAMRLTRELKIWEKAKHPNILKLTGYYLNENYSCAQLISPYMENGNITEYIKRTQASIDVKLGFVRDITSGMAYLHSCDPPICHGDLKPANVLINNMFDAVLCDFGLAAFVEDPETPSGLTTSRSVKGSTRYMSPELFQDVDAKHTLESDIWAWACTVFEIITGVIPYASSRSDGSIIAAISQGASPGPSELLGNLVSGVDMPSHSVLLTLQTLIPECWSVERGERPPSSSILKRLTYTELGNTDLPHTQTPPNETQTNGSDMAGTMTTPSSDQSGQATEGEEYRKIKLRSRNADSWVSEDAPEPEAVFSLEKSDRQGNMALAPNGKWLATSLGDGNPKLWNLEDPLSPQLGFPFLQGYITFEWSPDSRYLACFGSHGLYIWSNKSQTGKKYTDVTIESATWFSNGEDLVSYDKQRLSVLNCKSGNFQISSNLGSVAPWTMKMTTIPTHRVEGQKIVVMANCRPTGDSLATGVYGWFMNTVLPSAKYRQNGIYTVIVYDINAQKPLARLPQGHFALNITISRNGEFVLMSHVSIYPTLWRLMVPDSGNPVWGMRTALEYSFDDSRRWSESYEVRWPHFGGDHDEWVISATTTGSIIIWETQSSMPCQVIEGFPRGSSGDEPQAIYCPEEEKAGPLMFLFGHSNQDVVVWKWWKKSSK